MALELQRRYFEKISEGSANITTKDTLQINLGNRSKKNKVVYKKVMKIGL